MPSHQGVVSVLLPTAGGQPTARRGLVAGPASLISSGSGDRFGRLPGVGRQGDESAQQFSATQSPRMQHMMNYF